MKRFLTTLIAVAVLAGLTDTSAQNRYRPRPHRDVFTISDGLGFSFGYGHSSYRHSDWATEEKSTYEKLNGFDISLNKDFKLIDEALYLQTGLVYTFMNKSENNSLGGIRIIRDWDEHFLSIPVKIKYEIPVIPDLNVFIMGGPTISEELSSKIKWRGKVGEQNAAISYNLNNGKIRSNSEALATIVSGELPNINIRRFDVLLGFSAGVRFFEIFEAQLGYDWGLLNKYKDASDDWRMSRQQFYINLGMRF